MAIPDHPWSKATNDAAAVRIAMTTARSGEHLGVLLEVIKENKLDTDKPEIELEAFVGRINPDLTIGTDVTSTQTLLANQGLCSPGVKLHGDGFIVTSIEAEHLGLGKHAGLEKHIRQYRHGRDITSRPRGVMVIDLFGLSAEQVRKKFPEVYQHVVQEVKEKKDEEGKVVGRDANNRESYRLNWWLFGEPRSEMRPSFERIDRFIVTPVTSRHRFFQFLPTDILPDDALMSLSLDDAFFLGVLSSSIFLDWFASTGSTLEDRPRFIKARCYDPFPFPSPGPLLQAQIRSAAEELDAFRKERQREHPDLTLTQMYNVLEKLKAMEAAARGARKPSPLEGEGAERAIASEAG